MNPKATIVVQNVLYQSNTKQAERSFEHQIDGKDALH